MQPVSKQQLGKHDLAETEHTRNNGRAVFSMGVRAAAVAMQRHGKYASSTIEAMFSALSMPRSYLKDI
jgi:hypothetical protein